MFKGGDVGPNISAGAADIITHRSPSPVGATLIISQAVGHTAHPVEGVEEEELHYLKPDTEPDSGSEHSFQSKKSFDHFSFGEPFQTQSNHQRSETSSHRSNVSRGYSFNSSLAYSRSSQSYGSHRSSFESVREFISDKAESVGSVGSKNSRRLVTVGQSGSEGSERKAYPRRGAFKQIRSLGDESDDESF